VLEENNEYAIYVELYRSGGSVLIALLVAAAAAAAAAST
jgi:hypothetical protein